MGKTPEPSGPGRGSPPWTATVPIDLPCPSTAPTPASSRSHPWPPSEQPHAGQATSAAGPAGLRPGREGDRDLPAVGHADDRPPELIPGPAGHALEEGHHLRAIDADPEPAAGGKRFGSVWNEGHPGPRLLVRAQRGGLVLSHRQPPRGRTRGGSRAGH